jgi:hypothetical protein
MWLRLPKVLPLADHLIYDAPSHSTMTTFRASRALCLLLCLPPWLSGCFAARDRQSKWPSPDFYVEVEAGFQSRQGTFSTQKLQIWRDGLVVYRETVPPLPESLAPREAGAAQEARFAKAVELTLNSKVKDAPGLPVYKSLCAYRLAPPSVRMLSRMLIQSSIKDIPEVVGNTAGGEGEWLKMRYQSRGSTKEIAVHVQIFGPMNRVLHVVNSFLPEGHGFKMPEMVGVVEPPHVAEVPAVKDSLEGSLGYHRKLLLMERFSEEAVAKDERRRGRRIQLQCDTFALACAQRDIAVAEKYFRELTNAGQDSEGASQLFPDTAFDAVEHLQQILDAAKRGAGQ